MAAGVIGLYGNKMLDLNKFSKTDVDIYDIGWSLSHIHRFNGHSRIPYSVSEHCVALSKVVPEHLALEAFLHDAAEAYVTDIVSPIKILAPEIASLEDRLLEVIFDAFEADYSLLPEVYEWDWNMCRTEALQIMGDPDWARNGKPYLDWKITEEKSPEQRRNEYFNRFYELITIRA